MSAGTGNDLLTVTGSATLAGTLNLKLVNGFTPSLGQTFLIASYGSRVGTFNFVAPPHMPQEVAFQLDYTTIPTQLNVQTVAPVAQNWLPATSTTTWATPGNWDNQTTPGTTSSVSLVNSTATAKTLTVSTSTTVHRITLQGTAGAALNLNVPQGIQLGVANQVVVGPNATLSGGGQVLGDVVVGAGTVAPGAPTGALGVSGDLTASATGSVKVSLAGSPASGAFSQLNIKGTATLSGTLDVSLTGGYSPAGLDSFQVMGFGARVGHFNKYLNLDVPGALTLAPIYSATALQLVATLPGDATLDGKVDFLDLAKLAQSYNVTDGNRQWVEGDFNSDGAVDFLDLAMLAQQYNTALPAGAIPGASAGFDADLARAFANVPEPSCLGLLALGMLGLRRRHRRAI